MPRERRDGQDEPYALEPLSNGVRIRIGDKGARLADGLHRYEISYRTTRLELRNRSGAGDHHAVAGGSILQHHEFTGGYRSTDDNSRVLSISGTVFTAETTAALDPKQGFSAARSALA